MPRCSSCKSDLPSEAFHRNQSSCKSCQRDYRRSRSDYHARYRAEHKEHIRAYHREYNARNRENVAANNHASYLRNKAKVRSRGAQWAKEHPEETRAYCQKYRERNIDKIRAKDRASSARYRKAHHDNCLKAIANWKKANPERWRMMQRGAVARRRSRVLNNPTEPVNLENVIARDGMKCHICKRAVSKKTLSFDHIIPVSKGGAWAEWNLAVAHLRCNQRRGAGLLPAQFKLVI